jgi:general secretion pathway protein B
MSYILDALKKAEQERGNPHSQTLSGGRADRTKYRYHWWPILGAFLLCAATICLVLFYIKPAAAPPSQSSVPKEPKAIPEMTPIPSIVPSEAKREQVVAPNPVPVPENAQIKTAAEPKPAQTSPPRQNGTAVQRPAAVQHEQSPEPTPANLREAMQKMKITVLMYSEVPSERVVFINGIKYSEGDYVDGRYLLEKITMGGAELSYMGERALLRP